MSVTRETFLNALNNSEKGPNGEAPYDWNPNKVVADALCRLCDVGSLKELIRSGRVVKLNGEPFLQDGEELPDDDRKTFSEPESSLLEAIENGGVMVFDNLERTEPKPRHICGSQKTGYTISDPLSDTQVSEVLRESAGQMKIPEKPEKPFFLNVWWDGLLRKLGGKGTDAMCEYRRKTEKYDEALQEKNAVLNGADNIKSKGVAASKSNAAANRSLKTLRELVLTGSQIKKRYEGMKIVPSTAGNAVNDLHGYALNGLGTIFGDLTGARIADREKTEKNLASLVALDLILRERVAHGDRHEGDRSVPGPLETKLNKVGCLKFIDSIKADPAFRRSVDKMTHRGLDNFVSDGGIEELSKEMLSELSKQQDGQTTAGRQNVSEKTFEPVVKDK